MPSRSDPHPKPDDTFHLDGKTFVFPSGKMGVPFEIGKAARVYQVIGENHALHALKVFFPEYRSHSHAGQAISLSKYKDLNGLAVAERYAITTRDQHILTAFPQFENAILMPWISGKSWQNYILGEQPISSEESLSLVRELVSVVAELEENGLAHCDLSNGNFVFSPDFNRVELVDIEEMYSKDFPIPSPIPVGSDGYAPLMVVEKGYYGPDADRHALGILATEILCWQVERIRKEREGSALFASDEFGHKSQRYKLVKQCFAEMKPNDGLNLARVSELFDQVWFSRWKEPSNKLEYSSPSDILQRCPSVAEWRDALGTGSADRHIPSLTINVNELFFGTLQPNGYGAPSLPVAIMNEGGGSLSGNIISAPWLRVDPSTKIAHRKGQKNSSIAISLGQDFPRSRNGGEYKHPTGLVIQTNGGTKVLGVRYLLPRTPWYKKFTTWAVTAVILILSLAGLTALNKQETTNYIPTQTHYITSQNTPTSVISSLLSNNQKPTRTPTRISTSTPRPKPTNSPVGIRPTVDSNIKYKTLEGVPPITLTFTSERSTLTFSPTNQVFCYKSDDCTYEWKLVLQSGRVIDTKHENIYTFVFSTYGNYNLSLKVCYQKTTDCDTDTVSITINK